MFPSDNKLEMCPHCSYIKYKGEVCLFCSQKIEAATPPWWLSTEASVYTLLFYALVLGVLVGAGALFVFLRMVI